jgi:hypothetical protein
MLSDPILHEVLKQWHAWTVLVKRLLPVDTDPHDADPLALAAAMHELEAEDVYRIAHAFVGEGCAQNIFEAAKLMGELLGYAESGRRPRTGVEAGVVFE